MSKREEEEQMKELIVEMDEDVSAFFQVFFETVLGLTTLLPRSVG